MRKPVLIAGGLLLGLLLLAAALGFYLSLRSPVTVTQTPFEPIRDPDEKPGAYLGHLVFQEDGGRGWQYGVMTYGRIVRLQPGPGSFKVSVDDSTVEISPADDGLWAIGPDFQPHRLGVSFRDVRDRMGRGEAGAFVRDPFWRERLKPLLEQYRWPEQ